MAGHEDEEAGFWPGYVAAVSGLVQGLLIMAMALGISIFALGQLAQQRKISDKSVASGPRPQVAILSTPQTSQYRVLHEPRRPIVPPSRQPLGSEKTDTVAAFKLGFTEDAVILPKSSVPSITEAIAQGENQGAFTWRIFAEADLTNPHLRRAAYLRLLSVREALAAAGLRPDRIYVDLVPAGKPDDTSPSVSIVALDRAGQPLRLRGALP